MWLVILGLTLPVGEPQSEIKDDEVVVFYPTYARRAEEGGPWEVAVSGKIFEPEEDSLRRGAALDLLRRALGLRSDQAESRIFRQRASAFLVDNERGKTITIRLGGRIHEVGTSGADGHFGTTLRLSAAEVARLRAAAPGRSDWLSFQAVTRPGDRRRFVGRVQVIGPEGVSVISDIDDTIKVSTVADRRELMANTFLRRFRPVEGMPELYRRWADDGAVFHYLSGSPWQLYQPLSEFIRAEGFPAGTFHLKRFRLKDSTALNLFGSQARYKLPAIERILDDFPRRRFILVGDSGEEDPEIYGAAARNHPRQVVLILIREVAGRAADAARLGAAFQGVPPNRWKVFQTADQLTGALRSAGE